MSKVEDFKNAPVGATATHANGSRIRAMKMNEVYRYWMTQNGICLSDAEMEQRGYLLDPLEPAPTTAREALDLAWELAHPVKNGQVIPKGVRFLEVGRSVVKEYIAYGDREISHTLAPTTRTLEPLPEPEPDWLDAPAALDVCGCCGTETLHSPIKRGTCWECTECHTTKTWRELTDVTPLYPKEDA